LNHDTFFWVYFNLYQLKTLDSSFLLKQLNYQKEIIKFFLSQNIQNLILIALITNIIALLFDHASLKDIGFKSSGASLSYV